ncbi:MAG: aldehyde dehydrogenase family protein [Solirubrobacteraceae bacterium]
MSDGEPRRVSGREGADAVSRLAVRSPVDGRTVGSVAATPPSRVEDLVARGRAAQPGWSAVGFDARARRLLDLRAWIVRERGRLIRTMCDEGGKTYEDALLEVVVLCQAIGFWARRAERYLRPRRSWARQPLLAGRRLEVRYVPRGVVGVIAPWNYPLVLGLGDALPALMAGNATVIKPSDETPLSTALIVEEGFRAAGIPPDVCLVAQGGAEVGRAVVDAVDMIMFTGSTPVGREVAERAGRRLIPASVELGGKDPMIVLADADLERAANCAVYYGMGNAGQTCQAVERVYVEAAVYDEFVRRVTDKAARLRMGAPAGPGSVDIGPLARPGQREVVSEHVRAAVAAGARTPVGGDADGSFHAPTVILDPDPSASCMRDETFGPVLPIVKVRDAEEAIALANDSRYGLNSSVFTRDVRRGEAIARRIEAGASCINDACANFLEIGAPFGGWKDSGLGGRNGAEGIRKYCRQQTILTARVGLRRDPNMFPYRARVTRLLERALTIAYGRRS